MKGRVFIAVTIECIIWEFQYATN